MRARRSAWHLAAIPFLLLAKWSPAAGEEDPYLAIRANAAGTANYVRKSEIEALTDVSAASCIVILSTGEEIRVFQKCPLVAAGLNNTGLVSFANEFGMVFVTPSSLVDLLSTNNSGCRLNLKNRKFVSVNQSCESVHDVLLRE